ncbi:MAG: TIR domain-containing protein [Geminicoccaceae bacterium]
MSARPVCVFISYAHADRETVERLGIHLQWLEHDRRVVIFDDSKLVGGEKWERRLLDEISKADIVLLVVTADFTASHYCTQVELKAALKRCETADICLIPILAAPCDWEAMPITDRQALPKDAKLRLKPLSRWGAAREEALTQIAKHVRRNVEEIAARLAKADDQTVSPSGDRKTPDPLPGIWRQPEPPDRCLGRADDLAALVTALTATPPRPVVVSGGAGMGKSTLTREAAAAPAVLERYGDRRAWAELDRATEPAAVMAALVEALALPAGGNPWDGIEAALRQAPALLVLDNLETPWERHPTDVEDLLARLARIPGIAVIASIRGGAVPTRPAWGMRREVHRLVGPHDRDLLLAIAGDVPAADQLLPEALRALDGWPLAIELFAAQADGLGGLSLTWNRWQAERTAMLDRGETTPDRLSSLAVSLGLSLDSPRMKLKPPHPEDAALRLYAMMGRLPDGLASVDAESLLPGSGSAAAQCLLRQRLAYRDAERIRMLTPIREHAGRIALSPADRSTLHGCYLGLAGDLRRYFNGDYRGVDLPRLRAELINVEALLTQAVDAAASTNGHFASRREVGSLSLATGDARREWGQLAWAHQNYLQGMNVFLALTSRDPGNAQWQRDLSVSWNKLGDVRSAQGDLPGALAAFTEGKNIADRLAAADPGNAQWQRDLIVSHWKLADLSQRMPGRGGDAAGHWAQALAIARTLAATGRLAPVDAWMVEELEQRLAASRDASATPP